MYYDFCQVTKYVFKDAVFLLNQKCGGEDSREVIKVALFSFSGEVRKK